MIMPFNTERFVTTIAGIVDERFRDGKAEDAKFCSPEYIAIDKQGNIIVADTGNHRIRKIEIKK